MYIYLYLGLRNVRGDTASLGKVTVFTLTHWEKYTKRYFQIRDDDLSSKQGSLCTFKFECT